MSESGWYETFFPAFAGFAAPGFGEERDRRDAGLVARYLALEPPARLLDVPCGRGRVALRLAAEGYRVEGVDFLEPLVTEAREEAERRGVEARFTVGDMRELPSSADFDGAFCWFGSFGYFDEAGDREFLRALAGALRPGGRLLVEGLSLETLLPVFTERCWERAGGDPLLQERHFVPATSRVEVDWTWIGDGERLTRHSSIRIYSYRELTGLLAEAGFTGFCGFDTYTEEPFALGARRLSLVAEKL